MSEGEEEGGRGTERGREREMERKGEERGKGDTRDGGGHTFKFANRPVTKLT